uniref:Reverse transcriptase zinc-binding domain-containing protein n=1 Tax=Lactuca sativa TaxID=4236 RepID=A0A9R1WH27_LACSA|nr:hypothetical protein LSAT_V11C100045410 [Lactuca sativa]
MLSSRDTGGLGIGSLKAFNFALHLNRLWRIRTTNNVISVNVVKSIHEVHGGVRLGVSKLTGNRVWAALVKTWDKLHESGLIPNYFMKINVENRNSTCFWQEVWLGEGRLSDKYPRLYALEVKKNIFGKMGGDIGPGSVLFLDVARGDNSWI